MFCNSTIPESSQWNNKLHLALMSSAVTVIKRFDAFKIALIFSISIDMGSGEIDKFREVPFALNSITLGVFTKGGML